MLLRSDKYKSGEKALSRKEYNLLIQSISDLQDELLIKTAVSLGLRREDICVPAKKKTSKRYDPRRGVKIKNINLDDKTLIFFETKKNKYRVLNLPDSLVTLIRKYLKTITERENLFNYTGRQAYRRFNHWCEIAGIPQRPFHALRATCIKFAKDAGWQDPQIAALTGDSIGVIQQHYMVPSNDEMVNVTNTRSII